MSNDSLYRILGVEPSVSDGQLREAYQQIEQRLADATDPSSIENLRIAKEAYILLSTHRKRGPSPEPPHPANDESLPPPAETAKLLAPGEPLSKPSAADIFLAAIRQPTFLAFLAGLAALLVFWQVETHRNLVELQRVANEKAMIEMVAANNKILAEEVGQAGPAQARHTAGEKKVPEAETFQPNHSLQGMAAKQIEATPQSREENFQLIEKARNLVEADRLKARQEAVRQEMEMAQAKTQGEGDPLNAYPRQTIIDLGQIGDADPISDEAKRQLIKFHAIEAVRRRNEGYEISYGNPAKDIQYK